MDSWGRFDFLIGSWSSPMSGQPGEQEPRAIHFDNEGHIIHYTVRVPPQGASVVFESEADGSSPAARLVYQQADDRTMSVEFFVAPPAGQLESHVRGLLKRE